MCCIWGCVIDDKCNPTQVEENAEQTSEVIAQECTWVLCVSLCEQHLLKSPRSCDQSQKSRIADAMGGSVLRQRWDQGWQRVRPARACSHIRELSSGDICILTFHLNRKGKACSTWGSVAYDKGWKSGLVNQTSCVRDLSWIDVCSIVAIEPVLKTVWKSCPWGSS